MVRPVDYRSVMERWRQISLGTAISADLAGVAVLYDFRVTGCVLLSIGGVVAFLTTFAADV